MVVILSEKPIHFSGVVSKVTSSLNPLNLKLQNRAQDSAFSPYLLLFVFLVTTLLFLTMGCLLDP